MNTAVNTAVNSVVTTRILHPINYFTVDSCYFCLLTVVATVFYVYMYCSQKYRLWAIPYSDIPWHGLTKEGDVESVA